MVDTPAQNSDTIWDSGVWDPGTPPELVPTMGTHPNQRAYYQTILLDRFVDPPPAPAGPRELAAADPRSALAHWLPAHVDPASPAIEAAGQVDLTDALLSNAGFDRIAVGAVVEFSQSWYTNGLALGQLLHSLALAPGESTRIALVDWERRERGERMESTREQDQLTNQQTHTRALNEVVDAVAGEFQSGMSAAQSGGESWGIGKSGGGGGSYGGDSQGYGWGGGYSIGYGSGKSQASSWGVSTGSRNLRSELTQNIADLTQQASTMVRERWSTVVQEVSQEEHERLSTRAVTNYNHMHALTVQYYEVVQTYRVAIELNRVTRCLFVPMKVFDFRRRELVYRFREAIAAAALTPAVGTALRTDLDAEILALSSPALSWTVTEFAAEYGVGAVRARDVAIPVEDWHRIDVGTSTPGHPFRGLVVEHQNGSVTYQPFAADATRPPALADQQTAALAQPTTASDRQTAGVDKAPAVAEHDHISTNFDGAMSSVRRVLLRRDPQKSAYAGTVAVQIRGERVRADPGEDHGRWVTATVTVPVTAGTDDVALLDLGVSAGFDTISGHLDENALHYSQAIWQSLDAPSIALALARFTLAGRPLMEAIDPTPVTVAANYLVFRTYATDDDWQKFLDEKQLQTGVVSEAIVPLPTGGVFAEAVLGRANSAEKLDNSRFWNWQDSPIPIVASEIAALTAESRDQTPDLKAQPLSPTVLNITNPTPLPDPTGMTAALNALSQGTMFRDMSGLSGTTGLADAALRGAFGGSEAAQRWAAENFKTAASLVGKPKNTSEQGARANQGKDMDRRQQQQPGSVGPNEQQAYSDPPLVQAEPEGSDPGEWDQWPGDDQGSDLKHGDSGTTATTQSLKRTRNVTVTFELRWFIPAEAITLAGAPVAIRGDDRYYEQSGGSSRARIAYTVRLNPDQLRVTAAEKPAAQFGETELYWNGDTTQAPDSPAWWRQLKPGALPIAGTLTASDPKDMVASAGYRNVSDRVEVTFQLVGTPYFPWKSADFMPNVGIGPLNLRDIVGGLINTQIADVDAVVRVTITRGADGALQYAVSGTHDAFGGWELYVNGQAAWLADGSTDTARSTDPRNLWPTTGTSKTIKEEPRPLPSAR
ncbi:hypothetical protein [Cryptosporangium phraense]|uniref:Uncharacterized protein n=1 Tax=Cryptosporangium phraense TaxID=2593070 RepID=A0A545AQX8_9ACTN|nr:hypothetical protein [Cryptosporangium phraense]TQS43724.1 hypothetical protein FL583_16935 [Cryptosporangium phraense]